MVKYSCELCMWFDRTHTSLEGLPNNLGYCRKHKPVIFAKDNRYYGGWPLVDVKDLCGEWHRDEA
jgi:hypothetical protein